MCMSFAGMCLTTCMQPPQRPAEGMRSPGTGVTEGWEASRVSKCWELKPVSALNHSASSPAHSSGSKTVGQEKSDNSQRFLNVQEQKLTKKPECLDSGVFLALQWCTWLLHSLGATTWACTGHTTPHSSKQYCFKCLGSDFQLPREELQGLSCADSFLLF